MWFRKLTYAQKKELRINHDKMNKADNARAVKHPDHWPKSYSATHKPYDRTNYGDLNRRCDERVPDPNDVR